MLVAGAKAPSLGQKKDDDGVEVEYVEPDLLEDEDAKMPEKMKKEFLGIMERFKKQTEEDEKKEEGEDEDMPKKRKRPRQSVLEEDEDDDEEDDKDVPKGLSKKKKKLALRMSIAELKTLVKRPDVVEIWDPTSSDPRLLVYLKAYRNTVGVPRHWSSKRKYMAAKRGIEKPPFRLPEYIEQTGIAKIRQAIQEKMSDSTLKRKGRDRMRPKMGKLDIDYQVLHDAFFRYATKGKMSRHNEMYYEGKEYESKMMTKRPGQLTAAMKEALGMAEGHPPPWLINMQRYGPPPSYPNLKIPGLNAPIPPGAEYGYHPGGWGKPPVDEFGQPLYGDFRADNTPVQPFQEDTVLWGEVEDLEEEDDDDDEQDDIRGDGSQTPLLGSQTPLVGSGSATPVVSMDHSGVQSISGVSSVTSGLETPSGGTRSKRGGIASVSGVSSASLTPTPQLFQVLEEQKSRSSKGGLFPSQSGYKMPKGKTGGRTPVAGVGSSGAGTPLGGISTPIGGIGTPLIGGIGTPLSAGIGTPGIGTPIGGIGTPIGGIGTPIAGIGTPVGGIGTPHSAGIGTPVGGIGTPIGGIGTPGAGTPVQGIATPTGGIATPVGGIATPVGGIATPVGGIATPVGGIATPTGGIATPTGGIVTPVGNVGGMTPIGGGADTPGPVTMSLNPQDVEQEGILTADIIRQQLKQHEEAAATARLAAGQKEVGGKKKPDKKAADKSKKEKKKFKF